MRMTIQSKSILKKLYLRYPELEKCSKFIDEACAILADTFRNGGKLLIAGNGGSAADAQHIVGELMKGFMLKRETSLPANGENVGLIPYLQLALPAISLVGEFALSTAIQNDISADFIFAQQIFGLGETEDIFWGISTSGNSRNILYAAQIAKAKGMKVLGLTGISGGKLHDLCDVCIKAPSDETYIIQELHLPIYHAICMVLEQEFFGD